MQPQHERAVAVAGEQAPAIYRTTISLSGDRSFQHRGYSCYVDLDQRLPGWLRSGASPRSTRTRLTALLAARDVVMPVGRLTALLPVDSFLCDPLAVYWCHDVDGRLRYVIAEVHDADGCRHTYLAPPAEEPVLIGRHQPFELADGQCLFLAPVPTQAVDVMMSVQRRRQPEFTATLRGERLPASVTPVATTRILSSTARPVYPAHSRISARQP